MSQIAMPLNYYLRPFNADDYPSVIALGRKAFDNDMHMDIETLRRIDERRNPEHSWGRPLAIRKQDGQIHGMAQWGQLRGTDSFFFWIAVHPDHRRQGLGSALYGAIREAVAPYHPPSVLTYGTENDPGTLAFLKRHGFVEKSRSQRSQLHLTDFTPERFPGVLENLPAQGIAIQTLSQIASDPDARLRLYQTMNTLWEDVPSPEPFVPLPFDQWNNRLLENYLPEGFLIAVEEGSGAYVGITTLSRLPDSDHLDTGLTGVRLEYRRRGVALGLKVQAAQYALSMGAPVIHTANATHNAPMLALNERLGFQKQPARIRFVCHLEGEPVALPFPV